MSGVSVRDVYESDDPNYLLFVQEVIGAVVTAREDIARDLKRRSGAH